MSPLEQRITTLTDTRLAVITDTATDLKAQLFELERLREQVGKARLSAEKSLQRAAEWAPCYPTKNRP